MKANTNFRVDYRILWVIVKEGPWKSTKWQYIKIPFFRANPNIQTFTSVAKCKHFLQFWHIQTSKHFEVACGHVATWSQIQTSKSRKQWVFYVRLIIHWMVHIFSTGFLLTGWAIFKNTNMQKQGGAVIDGLFLTGFLFTGWAISKNTNIKKQGGTVIGGQNLQ